MHIVSFFFLSVWLSHRRQKINSSSSTHPQGHQHPYDSQNLFKTSATDDDAAVEDYMLSDDGIPSSSPPRDNLNLNSSPLRDYYAPELCSSNVTTPNSSPSLAIVRTDSVLATAAATKYIYAAPSPSPTYDALNIYTPSQVLVNSTSTSTSTALPLSQEPAPATHPVPGFTIDPIADSTLLYLTEPFLMAWCLEDIAF